MTSTDHAIATTDSTTKARHRRWSRRRLVIGSSGVALVALIGLLATVMMPGSMPPESTDDISVDQTESGPPSPSSSRRGYSVDDPTDITDRHAASPKGKVVSNHLPTSTGSSSSTPSGPLLVVESDIVAEPGANGALFLISNAGGSPLSWSVPQEDGVVVVDPEFGTIAPGASQLVSFELPHPLNSDFVYPITVESDGGTAAVNIHLDAFDPVFEIVDGTWNIRNGNTFLVSYTDMDVGLTLKNIGTQPLHVEPQDVDGLAVIGGPWDLAPGEEVHLHLVLCDAMFSGGVPDFHDREFHIHTDSWMGTLDFMVRFTLAPGQVALAC